MPKFYIEMNETIKHTLEVDAPDSVTALQVAKDQVETFGEFHKLDAVHNYDIESVGVQGTFITQS